MRSAIITLLRRAELVAMAAIVIALGSLTGKAIAEEAGPICDVCEWWYGYCFIRGDEYCCLDHCKLKWYGIVCYYNCNPP